MIEQTTPYGLSTTVPLEHAVALEHTRKALATEGFGILAEMDIAATLKSKLNVDFRPYVILGACNAPLAHRALLEESDIGLLLPCNVVVYAADAPGHSVVAAIDPVQVLLLTGNERIRVLAEAVKERLHRALETLERDAAM